MNNTQSPSPKTHHPERGNVLFYILIAVALFAALNFTVSQGNRGSTETLSEDKAKLYASEIITYANTVASAVAQTRLRGYTDTQISFENPTVSGYTNANCTDDVCKIFHPSGGGLTWQAPPEFIPENTSLEGWKITSSFGLTGIGTPAGNVACYIQSDKTACADLILVLYLGEVENLCKLINDKFQIDNPSDAPPSSSLAGMSALWLSKFTGTYIGSSSFHHVPEVYGKKAGCFKYHANDKYFFYKILIAR